MESTKRADFDWLQIPTVLLYQGMATLILYYSYLKLQGLLFRLVMASKRPRVCCNLQRNAGLVVCSPERWFRDFYSGRIIRSNKYRNWILYRRYI